MSINRCIALVLCAAAIGTNAAPPVKSEEDRFWSEPLSQADKRKVAKIMEANRVKACGKDYANMKIGMRFIKAKDCLPDLKLIGQVSTPRGTVSNYSNGDFFVSELGGEVIAWGK